MARPRILVIDDEKEVREAIAAALTLDGYDVQTAPDGREGSALLSRNRYDLIFCDLRMPEMDGRALYERMIQLDCQGVLRHMVFVTAVGRSQDYEPFLRAAGTQVLAKPFTLRQLREVVARMVGPEILRRLEIHRVSPGQ
jgi:CheY-like chemotaxis protein